MRGQNRMANLPHAAIFTGMGGRAQLGRRVMCAALLAATTGCALMPGELNLSPIYRHRLDRDGSVREMDVLWPIFHYRKTEDGGTDFRVRPLYRTVTHGDEYDGTEHQFVVPLGRVHDRRGEVLGRLCSRCGVTTRTRTRTVSGRPTGTSCCCSGAAAAPTAPRTTSRSCRSTPTSPTS